MVTAPHSAQLSPEKFSLVQIHTTLKGVSKTNEKSTKIVKGKVEGEREGRGGAGWWGWGIGHYHH